MSDRPDRLLLFARAPVPGTVKTRLQPDLPPEASLELHRAMVRDAIGLLRRVARREAVEPEVCFSETPDPGDPLVRESADLTTGLQQGADLGERLVRAFQERLHRPARKIVVFGSDSPLLTPEYVEAAFDALEECEVVLGPAEDGGYVLVGCTRLHVRPFRNIPWGSGRVLSETRKRLKRDRVPHRLLRPAHDLDTVPDLLRTYRELEHLESLQAESPAPHTLAALRQILHARPELYQRLRPG